MPKIKYFRGLQSMKSRPVRAAEIRQTFLDFFQSKGHQIVQPASLVVKGDPTLLFTNAGMNQFKDLFLGNRVPTHVRVADSQPCLRVSGKHNDLEDVGKDTYHHTLFEMLGNWSFGDYFKEDAIAWAWELLTEVYGLDASRLYVTYFGGDQGEQLKADTEARDYWVKWVASDRILPGSKKDNFWEMGETGPCGPCSEIHVDLRSDQERAQTDARDLINKDHPQVIELWNLVFMEFQRMADGSLQSLPAKHVDTGMGFERLCRAVALGESNYDTDVFVPLIRRIEALSGRSYHESEAVAVAMRVVSDHIRAVSLIIADGQLPSNAKAGYVCRRILRRAIRYGYTYLGWSEPTLYRLLPALVKDLGQVLPQLVREQNLIEQTLESEEASFLRTLAKGLLRIEDWMNGQRAGSGSSMDGNTAFELFDTYGFPPDLTALVLSEKGFGMDHAGFERAMRVQKERSRAATRLSSGDWEWLSWTAGDTGLLTRFVGYDRLETESRIIRYRSVQQGEQSQIQLVLETTPFYAASGGQVGDTGTLVGEDGEELQVWEVFKENQLWIHAVDRLPRTLDQEFTAAVHANRRQEVSAHHSATHLLHTALRQTLGPHVQQKGSLVAPSQLRFDFSHHNKLTEEEWAAVEKEVNAAIAGALPLVEQRELPLETALQQGATALFGEKYGDKVRVISYGGTYSMELCGGTHVANTAQIGWFKLTSETAIAAGIRRIEAVCGPAAMNWIDQRLSLLGEVQVLLKNPVDLKAQLRKTLDELSQARKKLDGWYQQQYEGWLQAWQSEYSEAGEGPWKLSVKAVEVPQPEALKMLATRLRNAESQALALLGTLVDGRIHVALGLGDAWKGKAHAGEWIKHLVQPLGGQGGGQPNLAMGSFPLPASLAGSTKDLENWLQRSANDLLKHFDSGLLVQPTPPNLAKS